MYEIFIARRYLRAKRQISLVTIISTIATAGVALGVAALICALAVFNGFSGVVTSLLVGFDPHVRIEGASRKPLSNYAAVQNILSGMPEVKAYSRYVDGRIAVIHRGTVRVISLRGVDRYVAEATGVTQHIIGGSFDIGRKDSLNGIVLGVVLADRLGITLGDTVTLVSPVGLEQTLTQFAQPATMRFRVTGVFSSTKEYDAYYAYTDLPAAQSLFGKGDAVDGVEIRLNDIQKSDEVKSELERSLATAGVHVQVLTWYDLHKDLYSVMEIERWVAYILLCIIIIVAAFTILGSLTMTVIEKQRDIALLKAVGATDKSVQRIFLFAGALVGIIGVALGSVLGWLLCWLQETLHLFRLDTSVYIISALPVEMRVSDFIAVGLAGLILCMLAAFYPAKRAARVLPAEALRWE